MAVSSFHVSSLPRRAGIGLKPEHFRDILQTQPDIGFFEIHAENYLMAGGPMHHFLGLIRAQYPLSIHGVGLSIGGEEDINQIHLSRLKTLIDRYQPESFSEHLAWSSHGGTYYNDLLPLPYTHETLDRVCAHIDQVQDVLKRRILLENPATYLEFSTSEMEEAQFITHIMQRTGCGLLLDVNNLYVSGMNHGIKPTMILEAMPLDKVGQIHLAGHFWDSDSNGFPLLIDNHGAPVADPVWSLYEQALSLTGQQATLLERDHAIPALEELLAEADRVENYLAKSLKRADFKSSATT
jgi:uncharacterized protein (UPF0276 family)